MCFTSEVEKTVCENLVRNHQKQCKNIVAKIACCILLCSQIKIIQDRLLTYLKACLYASHRQEGNPEPMNA